MGDKVAILVMMVPDSDVALSRLIKSLDEFRGDARVFASLDQGYRPKLPEWITPIEQPESHPSGIVRPTKYALSLLKDFDWVLRITWDAELVAKLDFPKDPWMVYGCTRHAEDSWSGGILDASREMGGSAPPGTQVFYPDGYAVLAHKTWWEKAYCRLPFSISHYADESVSFTYSRGLGYMLGHMEIARHRHSEWRRYEGNVYDCFPFFDECDLLEIRLHEMDPIVGKFILVEADQTHSGKPKPSYFLENKDRFKEFLPKIIHRIVRLPETGDTWVRERYQRDVIMDILKENSVSDQDLIVVSDLDEIPSRPSIEGNGIAFSGNVPVGLRQKKYNYKLNLLGTEVWCKGFAGRFKVLKDSGRTLSDIRCGSFEKVIDCGWHFSWCSKCMKTDYLKKVQAFAHQELNNQASIEKTFAHFEQGRYMDGNELRMVMLDTTFPGFILDNVHKFTEFFYQPGKDQWGAKPVVQPLLAAFWHVYAVNNWKEIAQEQFDLLVSSGLIDQLQFLHVNVVGDKEAFKSVFTHPKIRVTGSENLGEFMTLKHLFDYAAGCSAYVLYFHTKGVVSNHHNWRRYMQNQVIGRWRECVDKLADWDAVGVEYRTKPFWHFSGNFWWARSDHIRTLGDPSKLKTWGIEGEEHKKSWGGGSEYWLGHTHSLKAFSFHNVIVNNYVRDQVTEVPTNASSSRFSEFLYRILLLGSNSVGTFGGVYEGGIQLQQVPEELAATLNWLLSRGPFRSLLEVGSAGGGMSRVMKDALNIEQVYIIDDNKHSTSGLRKRVIPEAKEWVGDSHCEGCAQQLVKWGEKFDIVVLDGDSSQEGVIKDIKLVLPHTHPKTLWLIHDVQALESVRQVLGKLRRNELPIVEEVTFGEFCQELCGMTIAKSKEV